MDWSEERYVRLYARTTSDLLAFGWGASYLVRKRYPGRIYAHVLAAGLARVEHA